MNYLQSSLVVFAFFLLSQNTLAQQKVKIGKLYYNLSGAVASVTCSQPQGGGAYAGGASLYEDSYYEVPPEVNYNGLKYTVISLDRNAFAGYRVGYSVESQIGSLATKIKLPNTVKTIGEKAFCNCRNLLSMVIPESVTDMASNVFTGCDLLREIVYLSNTPPSGWSATTFTYVPNKEKYLNPSYTMGDANVIPMITIKEKSFVYTGNPPALNWENNMSDYDATLDLSRLHKDAGEYIDTIVATFTKDGNSFIAHIPYKYTIMPITLTAQVEDVSREYGEENPQFTISFTGFINNEDETMITTMPIASTTATANSDIGTYPIRLSGGKASNYSFDYVSGTLTVNKASLQISVNNETKVYGARNPEFSLNYSGLKNNETRPAWIKSPIFSTTAEVSSNVGSYPVDVSCDAKNYNITNIVPGTLTISKAPLQIKVNNISRLYYVANPEFTYSCSGFVNGDNILSFENQPTLFTDANINSKVGTYEITAKDASSSNYSISYQPGILSINPRSLVASVGSYERAYNTANPVFEIVYNGFVGNDNESILNSAPIAKTEADEKSDVGIYKILLSGGDALNYKFSYTSGPLTINKEEQTLEWNQDLSNVQVGSQVELTAVASSGLPVEYTMDSNNSASLYKVGSKTYINMKGVFYGI